MKTSKFVLGLAVAGMLAGAGAFAEEKKGEACEAGAACGHKDCKCKDKKNCKCKKDKNGCSSGNGCHEKAEGAKEEASEAKK